MGAKCKGCGSCILFIVTTIIVYKLSLPVFLENFDPEGDVPSDTRYLPKADRTYSGRHILCHKFEGGLGSLLFQYAALLGISQNENRILVGNGDMALQNVLKGTRYKVEKSQCRNVVHVKEIACCRFDEKLTNLDRGKNYEIVGVLNSWKYFKDNVEDIRKAIVLQDSFVQRAKYIIQRALESHNHSATNSAGVGVHVRRGDKLHWTALDIGYRVAPREYFIRAMKYYRENVKGEIVFFVVTDDLEWCKGNLLGLPGVVLTGQHEPAVDLAILSLLDHSIISLGAFSWWGAFLAKGTVVYYRDFVDKDSKIYQQFDPKMEDYFPSEWIALP
ncbi:hypothetical protein BsWGS_17580 [Bradybaena similaris]